jgi:hypothetical protein
MAANVNNRPGCKERSNERPVAIVEHTWDDDDRLPTAELDVALLVALGFALVAFPRQY